MLLTSHYMEDIERLCERILILRDGELVYDGSLARVVRAVRHAQGGHGAPAGETSLRDPHRPAFADLGEVARGRRQR